MIVYKPICTAKQMQNAFRDAGVDYYPISVYKGILEQFYSDDIESQDSVELVPHTWATKFIQRVSRELSGLDFRDATVGTIILGSDEDYVYVTPYSTKEEIY